MVDLDKIAAITTLPHPDSALVALPMGMLREILPVLRAADKCPQAGAAGARL